MDKKPSESIVLSVRVPQIVIQSLGQVAQEEGKSSSDLFRYALSLILLPAQSSSKKWERLKGLVISLGREEPILDYLHKLREELQKTIGEHEKVLAELKKISSAIQIAEETAREELLKSLENIGRSEP